MSGFEEKLKRYCGMTEKYLDGLFTENTSYETLLDAMRYSLMAGGKRLRPALLLAFCEASGGRPEEAAAAGAAVELLHTFSLIHDDLPCMDDSDLRRGRPTNHKVYGEAVAVLAGDALLVAAFRILSQMGAEAGKKLRCIELLAEGVGENGMAAGQLLDLDDRSGQLSYEELKELHDLKTGRFISAVCRMGVVLGGGSEEQEKAAEQYGAQLGLAFQIRDDCLDVIGDPEELGKSAGTDEANGRVTFVDLLGLEGCDREVQRLTESAAAAVREAGFTDTDFLIKLAFGLAERKK